MTGAPRPEQAPLTDRLLTNKFMALKACKHGLMLYNVNDMYVGRSLEAYGEWCEQELNLLSDLLEPGQVAVDVGANIGTHTVFFARKVTSTGLVFSFEPQRLVYYNLCGNVAVNALYQVKCLNAAAGSESGTIKVPLLDPTAKQNYGGVNLGAFESGDDIPVIRLDDLELPRCDLIKVDVEGMETQVLEGARDTVSRCSPALFVENNREEGSSELIETVQSFGYVAYWHFAGYYNSDNYFGNEENIFPGLMPEPNMLCLREEIQGAEARLVTGADDNWRKARKRISSA